MRDDLYGCFGKFQLFLCYGSVFEMMREMPVNVVIIGLQIGEFGDEIYLALPDNVTITIWKIVYHLIHHVFCCMSPFWWERFKSAICLLSKKFGELVWNKFKANSVVFSLILNNLKHICGDNNFNCLWTRTTDYLQDKGGLFVGLYADLLKYIMC